MNLFLVEGAVFFAKKPSEIEVINDTNKELINFYRVAKLQFNKLSKEIEATIHSRDLHRDAWTIYKNPHLFTPIQRASSIYLLAHQSFSAILAPSWGYDKKKQTTSKKIKNKRENFQSFAGRLDQIQIESRDAIKVIKSRDTAYSFFYCDPPYYNSDMGHYDGYTIEDFEMLLSCLSSIKGKFLLSSYPSDILKQYTLKNNWYTQKHEYRVSVNKSSNSKRKIEVLTANFVI